MLRAIRERGPLTGRCASTSAPVSPRWGCFRRRGLLAADVAQFCQPSRSRQGGGNESGYAQIDIKPFPVEATASTKNLDRADVLWRSSPETWYEPDWRRECYPVRKLDPQSVLLNVVNHAGSPPPRLGRTFPGTGGPREVRTQLFLYPARDST